MSPNLEDYKAIDLLSIFVHEIKSPKEHGYLMAIPILRIEGKAVHLHV